MPPQQEQTKKVAKKLTQRPQDTSKRLTHPEKLLILAQKDNASSVKVARQYGVSDSTVRKIWKDRRLQSSQAEVAIIKKDMADNFCRIVDAGAKQVLARMGDANVQQASMAMGVAFDKYRLMTNQSTQNHSVLLNIVNEAGISTQSDDLPDPFV
jgi:transposase-like protein